MKIKKTFVIFLFIITCITTNAVAGDFMLYIADKNNNSRCAATFKEESKTSDEVSRSLQQYFSGISPDIGFLHAAFTDGHLHFCGTKELNSIRRTLYKIKASGHEFHKKHLYDFILIINNIH